MQPGTLTVMFWPFELWDANWRDWVSGSPATHVGTGGWSGSQAEPWTCSPGRGSHRLFVGTQPTTRTEMLSPAAL